MQEHLTILTAPYLEELLLDAGFSGVFLTRPRGETQAKEHFTTDVLRFEEDEVMSPTPKTLVAEGIKATTHDVPPGIGQPSSG